MFNSKFSIFTSVVAW